METVLVAFRWLCKYGGGGEAGEAVQWCGQSIVRFELLAAVPHSIGLELPGGVATTPLNIGWYRMRSSAGG